MADTQEDIDLAQAELELAQAQPVEPQPQTQTQPASQEPPYSSANIDKAMERAANVNVGNAAKSFLNSASIGMIPAAIDAAKSIEQDPFKAPQIAIGHVLDMADPITRGIGSAIPVKETRQDWNKASGFNPQAGVAGAAPMLAEGIPAAAKAISSTIDQLILSKLGPKALQMANDFAQSVIMRGTQKSSQQIQDMRRSGAMDEIKKQFIDMINPGITEPNAQVADRLASNANPMNPVGQKLQSVMAPGVNKAISQPAVQNSLSTAGAAMNAVGKKSDLIGYRSSKAIAQKALDLLSSKTGQNIGIAEAVNGRTDVADKMRAIAQMEPQAAAAFAYAESLVSPAFRMAWMEAQNDSGNQQ